VPDGDQDIHDVNAQLPPIMSTYEYPDSKRFGIHYPKTPTSLLYARNEKDDLVPSKWGWSAEVARFKQASAYLRRFKLHLSDSSSSSTTATTTTAWVKPLPDGLNVVKCISDYLRFMKEMALEDILRNRLVEYPSEIQWCLTVPAIWSTGAVSAMKQASVLSGMLKSAADPSGSNFPLITVPEPEAASLYCLLDSILARQL
jgi:hypothetical protein